MENIILLLAIVGLLLGVLTIINVALLLGLRARYMKVEALSEGINILLIRLLRRRGR